MGYVCMAAKRRRSSLVRLAIVGQARHKPSNKNRTHLHLRVGNQLTTTMSALTTAARATTPRRAGAISCMIPNERDFAAASAPCVVSSRERKKRNNQLQMRGVCFSTPSSRVWRRPVSPCQHAHQNLSRCTADDFCCWSAGLRVLVLLCVHKRLVRPSY